MSAGELPAGSQVIKSEPEPKPSTSRDTDSAPPAKPIRLAQPGSATEDPPVPPPLISALEEALEELYLVRPGSLRQSYKRGQIPPRKDS